MVKFGKFLISFLGLITFFAFLVAGIVLFRPDIILNENTLKLALDKSGVFREWSYETGEIETHYIDFNTRRLTGKFKNFCFKYDSNGAMVDGCLDTFSWDLTAHINLNGIKLSRPSPVVLDSKLITIETRPNIEIKQAQDEKSTAPDLYGLWKTLWADFTPDLYLNVDKINVVTPSGQKSFDIKVEKLKNRMKISSLGFELRAGPRGLEITSPKKLKLPMDAPFLGPIHIYRSQAQVKIREQRLDLRVKADALGATLFAMTHVRLPLKGPPGDWRFLKEVVLNTSVNMKIEDFKKRYQDHVKEPYNTLPAPLNALDGEAKLKVKAREGIKKEEVEVIAQLIVDMEGGEQELEFQIDGKGVVDLKRLRPGAIFLGGELYKVVLQVPKMPKKSLPPQIFSDGRIYRDQEKFHKGLSHRRPEEKSKLDLNMRIKALQKESLSFRTNLLTRPLRLNTDLRIKGGELSGGFVKVLPFQTEFFNREINLEKFLISFDDPKNPEVSGEILFNLPEYDVTLSLQGPLSSPRHSLSSEPPLPEEDIYAVLLFGRPMIDLEGGDRDAAQRTNQVLSQGVLSVGVLYYLSDTPIQAIIYDPDSEKVQAQFGISEKASLTVGAGSVGVRQSLGNGWYVDTSKNTDQGYGLMLERIIAY